MVKSRWSGILLAVGSLGVAVNVTAQTGSPMPHGPEEHSSDSPMRPGVTMHVFSDVIFRADRVDSAAGGRAKSQSFSLGQYDLYMTASVSPGVSILSETAFKLTSTNVQSVEVERIFIRYRWADLVEVSAGRTHTALGYWNEAYHHGALLQPTISRPEILRFGGVMPLHTVGIEVAGSVARDRWSFSYVGNLGNGRYLDPKVTQGSGDVDRVKARALKATFGYEGPISLRAGPILYVDRIPPDPAVASRKSEIDETIVGGHAVGRAGPLNAIGEYFRMFHETRGAPGAWTHEGWYSVITYRIGSWKPYGVVDVTNFAPGDPYLAKLDTDVRRLIAGLSYDVNPLNAIRVEYRNENRTAGRTHVLALQTAFAF